jgi:hypothetical protein
MVYFHSEEEFQSGFFEFYANRHPGTKYRVSWRDDEEYIVFYEAAHESDNSGELDVDEGDPGFDRFYVIVFEIIESIKLGKHAYNGFLAVDYRDWPTKITDIDRNVSVYPADSRLDKPLRANVNIPAPMASGTITINWNPNGNGWPPGISYNDAVVYLTGGRFLEVVWPVRESAEIRPGDTALLMNSSGGEQISILGVGTVIGEPEVGKSWNDEPGEMTYIPIYLERLVGVENGLKVADLSEFGITWEQTPSGRPLTTWGTPLRRIFLEYEKSIR